MLLLILIFNLKHSINRTKMIFFISSLFLLFSCQKKESVNLVPDKVIKLKMPISFYPNRATILNLEKDTNIVLFNWRMGELYIYNNWKVKSKQYHGYRAIFVKSLDSIFLIDKYNGKILLTNSKFDSLDSWDVPIRINNIRYLMNTNLRTDFLDFNGKFYLTVYPNIVRDSFYTKYHEIIYSMKNRKIDKLYMKFPNIYSKINSWGTYFISKTINNKNEIFFMYPMYKNVFRLKGNKIEEIEMPQSKYLTNFPPEPIPYPTPHNSKYGAEFGIKIPSYVSFQYDKYRNLYYKIVNHSQELYDGKLKTTFLTRPWSIMIFNDKFELLKEMKMPKSKYFNEYFYILPDGIYFLLQDEDNFDGDIKLQKFKVEYEK